MSNATIIFLLTLCIMILICIIVYQQFVFHNGTKAKIHEISSKLKELLDTDSDEKVTVFTDNKALIELATQINRMLEDRQKVKVEYRRAEMASKKMLSNISHDIKTPMTVILGYLEIMRLNGTQSNEMLQKVESTAQRVMGLITQFFTLAKLEAAYIILFPFQPNEFKHDISPPRSASRSSPPAFQISFQCSQLQHHSEPVFSSTAG